jgi:tetratricopeptide (TPR) repeat protein
MNCAVIIERVLLTFCLIANTSVTSWAQTEKSAPVADSQTSGVAHAQALLGSGKTDEAIEVLRRIESSGLTDPLINHLLGIAYYQKADYLGAIERLSLLTKRADHSSRIYRQSVPLLGLSHYSLGQVKEAIPYLEQVVNWSPENTEMVYALGICYIQTRDTDRSREIFAKLFGLQPGSASSYLVNAKMMIRQRFEELAEKEVRRALELDPKLPQANFLLGELAIFKANIDQGIELLRKEIALNPAFSMAYYRLGEAYSRLLKWDEAIPPLLKSISLNWEFSGPYIVLGKAYWKKGDLLKAEGALRTAVKMDPNNFSGHHLLAQVLQQANRPEEARKEFELAERLRTGSDK